MAEEQYFWCTLEEEQDICCKMQLANFAFRRMFSLFTGVSASLELKIRVRNALVRPVLLYSSGTWGLTTTMKKNCVHFIVDISES